MVTAKSASILPQGHASQRLRTKRGTVRERLREHARLNSMRDARPKDDGLKFSLLGLASPGAQASDHSTKMLIKLQQKLHDADATLKEDA